MKTNLEFALHCALTHGELSLSRPMLVTDEHCQLVSYPKMSLREGLCVMLAPAPGRRTERAMLLVPDGTLFYGDCLVVASLVGLMTSHDGV